MLLTDRQQFASRQVEATFSHVNILLAELCMRLIQTLNDVWVFHLSRKRRHVLYNKWTPYLLPVQLQWWWFGVVGNDVGQFNEVALYWDGWSYQGSTTSVRNLSWSNQLPRSTQPGHPSIGRHKEYQPKGGDAVRLGSKGRYRSCLEAGKTAWTLV